jgi:lysophospholipid acyltransferase (LPLAT)-like uncharacterized protein
MSFGAKDSEIQAKVYTLWHSLFITGFFFLEKGDSLRIPQ